MPGAGISQKCTSQPLGMHADDLVHEAAGSIAVQTGNLYGVGGLCREEDDSGFRDGDSSSVRHPKRV